jgi:hypothetical protein
MRTETASVTDCVTMTMMESPMDRTRIGPNPKMGRETNLRKETETKTETGMEAEMETETRIQEISSAIRTNSAVETAGATSLSGRTGQVRAAVFVTHQAPEEMRREAENAKQERRLGLLSFMREKRLPLFSLLIGETMKKIGFVILMLILSVGVLRPDTLSLSLFQNVTDNLFQNTYAEPDHLSNMSFSIDKNFSRISFFAFGEYSYLFENSDIAYYSQDLGLDYLQPLNDKSALYFSLLGRGYFYKSDYSDYNYFSVNGYIALKSYLSQTSILKSSYTFEYKSYRTSIFDFLSHSLFISADKYFPSKTTLKAEMNWGYKYFFQSYQTIIAEAPVEMPSFQAGKGRGKHAGMGNNQNMIDTPVSAQQDGGEGIQVFSASVLLAQGIGNNIGINLTGMKQWVLSGENPFDFVEEFYMVENPSYDRFSWSGIQIGSQVSFLIPWNTEMKVDFKYTDKEFPGIESLNLDGEPIGVTRNDQRSQWGVRVQKNFARITLFLAYSYVVNRSNDPYYDWKGNYLTVGFTWDYFYGERK